MGGGISVESDVGKGSTFTLALPRAPRMDSDRRADGALALARRPLHEASHSERPEKTQ